MQTKQSKDPTPKQYFEMRAICPGIIAHMAVTNNANLCNRSISQKDKAWFTEHADSWVRWFHANNPKWRKKLDRESTADLDYVCMFIHHWACAFVHNPEDYKKRHHIY